MSACLFGQFRKLQRHARNPRAHLDNHGIGTKARKYALVTREYLLDDCTGGQNRDDDVTGLRKGLVGLADRPTDFARKLLCALPIGIDDL